MSTADVMTSQKLTSQQLRKIKKPIIEKKRRERINDSLNQLKTLVLDALEKDESQYSKMEKADILEMTVKHLKNLKSRLSAAQALVHSQESSGHVLVNKYKAGFKECAEEVHRYLDSVPTIHPGVKDHLNIHLNSCSSGLEPTSQTMIKASKTTVEPCRTDSANSTSEPSLPVAGVQIGIPVMNGPRQPMVLAGQVASMHMPQGYVPVLISPGSGSNISSGISVVSPQQLSPSSMASGVIPLYTNTHYSPGSRSPSLESSGSTYSSSPMSSPPNSPVSNSSRSTAIGHSGQSHLSKLNEHSSTDNNVHSAQPRLPHQKNLFTKDTCGYDMYRYSKEILIQPSGGSVWRPW